MLRLLGIAISIGLADSLNPSTIAPALYLAAGERPRDAVTKFTIGVFAVYLFGGLVIAAGPGQLLLSLVPRPDNLVRQLLEVGAGVAMLAVGSMLWRHRDTLVSRDPPSAPAMGRSHALLGAGISAVELPTAFPYFFVIAAIVGSGRGLVKQVFLIVIFNLCFVLPLLAIVATLWVFGDRAGTKLARAREFLQRYWPALLAGVALVAGSLVIAIGATGIASRVHGRFGRFFRHVHKILPHVS
jgi:cytochrome c biogenesis protein CcdA